ncbi:MULTISPECIES: superoxide dismutase family protein [unclassified Hyphomicrobium]|uniref:superoxide dismutase family protein n=1 Tax=unclassified Hyphomicrobium TaxID=2619925 RepID=UPI000213E966|nr:MULTISPECIES: superoxide dismutase family protein [unclassified Hyphomicrobium]CCB67805.1 Superoxide dismutase [Cu-Zn] [Hyphomicrobium sp. MC1]
MNLRADVSANLKASIRTIGRVALGVLVLAVAGPADAAGEKAVAEIKLANGSSAGTVTLTDVSSGVLLAFDLKGLPPGAHAFGVHEGGKCEGDFSSAGPTYNPLGAQHGFMNDEGPMAGDLPNIVAGPDGTARAEMMTTYLHFNVGADDTLFDADGSSLVIYDKADDYRTDQDGSGEKRIACGVIKQQ